MPEVMFREYYKFAVIRNPWSRVVSIYRYLSYFVPFRKFVVKILPSTLWQDMYWFVRPAFEYLCDASGQLVTDDILRIESLAIDFERVRKRCNLEGRLQRINISTESVIALRIWYRTKLLARGLRRRDTGINTSAFGKKEHHYNWRKYYDAERREVVTRLYDIDIRQFGYAFNEE